MKTVIEIDSNQDRRWDKFIERHPLGWISHTSGWKNFLERSFKHIRGHHLAVVDGEEIVAALPIFAVRSWLTGKRLVSVPFATLSDPLLSALEDMGILLDAVLNLSNKIGAKYVEIRTTALISAIFIAQFYCRYLDAISASSGVSAIPQYMAQLI
jgi:hypothetical protein